MIRFFFAIPALLYFILVMLVSLGYVHPPAEISKWDYQTFLAAKGCFLLLLIHYFTPRGED